MYTEPLQFCILYVYVNILLPYVWQYKGAEYIETRYSFKPAQKHKKYVHYRLVFLAWALVLLKGIG